MKNIKKKTFNRVLILVLLTAFLPIAWATGPHIYLDEDDCVDGWLSMDMTVEKDGERFSFYPSCSFSFRDSFTTSEGVRCDLYSGMCSSFSGAGEMEVDCSDGEDDMEYFDCPEN